jgi:opacity protein-like surface antigen
MSFRRSVLSSFLCRTMAVAAVAVSAPLIHAQQPAASTSSTMLALNSAMESPIADLRYKTAGLSSIDDGISSSVSPDAIADERQNLSSDYSVQPPPRRRVYGRPRYSDGWHNPDGSPKFAFEAGAGFAAPTGNTSNYQTISWKFSVGAGLNFNKKFGILGQFDFDRMNVPENVVTTLQNQYAAANPGSDFTGFDMNTHIWSLTANPIYNYYVGDRGGAYVIGGIGYGRKTTNFTLPVIQDYCDYFYGCYPVQSNQTFDNITNGGLLLNAGLGFTYKISHFGNEKLFAEARYQWLNPGKNTNDFYTPNGAHTGYFPVTVGVRW